MFRATVAVLAVFSLTAFAPAPFPRTRRENAGTSISLRQFQGKWRSLGLEGVQAGGKKSKIEWGIAGVRVQGDLWTFLNQGDTENAKYRLTIDGTKKPATIDFYSEGVNARLNRPYMLGIIRRDGDRVQILYFTTGPENRARSFENPPQGWWLLTLERSS